MYKNIASVAALIGDSTRANILVMLSDGRSLTAGELARITKVSPQTASSHLAKMVEGGLLVMQAQGRHRYYRMANHKVADILEAIAEVAPPSPVRSLRQSDEAKALRFARTCYEHLAGVVGIALTKVFVERGYFRDCGHHYELSDLGVTWLDQFGIHITGLHRLSDSVPKHIDWTERYHHIGGPIAVAITHRLLDVEWIRKGDIRRSIVLTKIGEEGFRQQFGIVFDH